ncbi:pilus assembly protein [Altererythrobacter aurantiacus]|uniref:Pilus assembly protein n=1 Tax=Parapontixanthobacter aurantiacus TaxID=1463599 RepID=A0A844Z9U1_9SPHN|nr:pilus assembly protein TadG-related protein [Parapontixanthobacter aurantiacus]MXO85351.1 pilus assembly protein [Parapontixanthobacter aurantiacus]
MGRIRNKLHQLKADKSGNAMLIVALAMPGLVGGAGYAVDTAQWYLWKRELQHSVDQAAYAGAWAMANENSQDIYQRRAVQEYNANLKVTKDFASNPRIRLAGYAGGSDNSVVVSASASKSLPFSSFLTGKAATISVRAQASFEQGFDYNACLISTATEGTGTLVTGSGTINAKCGFAALSCDENAIEINGAATIITDSMVACGTISANGTISNGEDDSDESTIIKEKRKGLEDTYKDLVPPDDSRPRSDNCSGKGQNKQASLLPGTYSSIVVKCTTVLASGIYVIDGGLLDLSANYNVTGNGVMFVLRNGARIKLGGSGNSNSLNLTPPTEADLLNTPAADMAHKLAGILIFEERDNDPPNPGHQMNGNSNSLIEGLIYLPASKLTVNGTADVASQCLQITAYRLEVQGNANIETLCPSRASTSVGTGVPDVRLVA